MSESSRFHLRVVREVASKAVPSLTFFTCDVGDNQLSGLSVSHLVDEHHQRDDKDDPESASRFLEKDMRTVQRLRESVNYLRQETNRQRGFLHEKQGEFFDADEQYQKVMREFHASKNLSQERRTTIPDELESLWRISQSKRNESGPLVYTLGQMEDRLSKKEGKLSQANLYNSTLFSSDLAPEEAPEPSTKDDEISIDSDSNSSGSSDPSWNLPPLYVEYQSTLGRQDILLERYAYFLGDKDRLEMERERRRQVGLTLDKLDEQFLKEFPKAEKSRLAELDGIAEDIQRLKNLCIDEGIVDLNGDLIEEIKKDNTERALSTSTPKAPVMNSPMRSNGNIGSPQHNGDIAVDNDDDEEKFESRINPWLFDRVSAVDVALLATIMTTVVEEPDFNTSDDATRFWDKDCAGRRRQDLGDEDDVQTSPPFFEA
ncbi:hypothetical protein V501_03675 [Pseudogymnoascus sp. VKM F-4519 (FW-2642)]|nr:hypothetical protein V501_03675 [Pseudogymnoascus sp. VKM F-4519 (FW-2642)]